MTVCYEDGSPLGSCALNVWFDKENKKGSEWLPIRRADDPTGAVLEDVSGAAAAEGLEG